MVAVNISTGYTPRKYMLPFHATEHRFACVVAHRRFGKTVAAINDLIKGTLSCTLPNPRGAYIAPTYQQAKDVAWTYLKDYCRAIPGVKFHESELRVDFPTGARIRLYGAENFERLRGIYLDYVVIDEVADMAAEAWVEVIRPTLVDRKGRATFIGTPKGRNLFYDIFRLAEKSDRWFVGVFPVTETDVLSSDEVEDARLSMPPNVFAREFMCDFGVEAENQLIGLDLCQASIDRTSARGNGPLLLGVDVARFGDDRTVLFERNGDKIEDIAIFRGLDLMQVTTRVAARLSDPNKAHIDRCFVDGIGVGGGVVDRLKQLGFTNVVDVNSSRRAMDEKTYTNLRAEMWFKGREWIATTGQLPDNREFMDDLTGLQFMYDLRNRYKMESKDDLRKRGLPSPDIADAFMLTFAEPVMPKDFRGKYMRQSSEQVKQYDPFKDDMFNGGAGYDFEQFL